MKVNDIFINGNTFTATVAINIPGKDADRAYSPTVEYRYLDQDQLDALLSGESIEIDGQTVESGDDAGLLDKVLVGWKGWKVNGEEIQYDPENHDQALKHPPIRTPMVTKYFERLTGGARGGKRGKQKN